MGNSISVIIRAFLKLPEWYQGPRVLYCNKKHYDPLSGLSLGYTDSHRVPFVYAYVSPSYLEALLLLCQALPRFQ